MKYLMIVWLLLFICPSSHAITSQYKQLLLSTAKAMNVNGSGGNTKTFTFSAAAPSRVIAVSALLKDEGNTQFSNFGALAGLTNGILLQWSKGGVTTTLATIKDNADMSNIFSDMQHFGNSAVLSLLSIVTPEGFGNTNNVFRGKMLIGHDNILNTSDSVSAIVQDNLTNIDVLEMGITIETD